MEELDSKQKYKLKLFINDLKHIRGRHTELVTVYIPQGSELLKTIQQLEQEQGTASNIKDKKTKAACERYFELIVEAIVDMAFLVGQDSQGSINKQKKALLSENEVLRFWAAIGLKCQPTQNIQPYLGTIKNLAEQDPDAAQVVLASIVSEQTGDHKALKKVLESNDPILSWMAIQMLLYQKNRADLVLFVKEIEEIRKSDKAFEQFSLSANILFYLEGLQPAAIP